MCNLRQSRQYSNTFWIFLGGTKSQTQSRGNKGILMHYTYVATIYTCTINRERIQ